MPSSDKPKCKLCGERHWLTEPHKLTVKKFTGVVVPDHAPVTPRVTPPLPVTQTVTEVTPAVTQEYVSVLPLPGEPCPTCGRKMPMSHAQRQAAYRGRKS
jgi:hypothetical protein